MAKDDVLRAIKKMGGAATSRQVFEYLRKQDPMILATVVWQACQRLEQEGLLKYNSRTKEFKLTGKAVVRNVVVLVNGKPRRIAQ